jgi:hypothetical protein
MRAQFAATLIAVQWLASIGVCAAQERPSDRDASPSRVLVELEGGLAGTNLVRILTQLQEKGLPIPSRPVEVREGDSLCLILTRAEFPPPCSTLAAYISKDRAFPGKADGRLNQGDIVSLPDVQPTIKTVVKSMPRYVDTQRKLEERLRAWNEHSPVQLPKQTETEISFQHRLYSVTFPFVLPEQAKQAALAIEELKLSNIALEVVSIGKRPILHASLNLEQFRTVCEAFSIESATTPYLQMFFDRDLAAVKIQEAQQERVPRQRTPIYLIDTKLLPMPNLFPAFGTVSKAVEKPCEWKFQREAHHANHLAGIIASQGKGYVFEGISRHSVLRSYNLFATAEEMQQQDYQDLPDYIQANAYAEPLRIFLMAHSKQTEQHAGYLPNKNFRFHVDRLGKAICCRGRMRPIVIAAAGDGGINIDARTNLFPQVLGDAGNVIVVTACVDCRKGKATLLPEANHSAEFVHVAAPGGQPVPGWTGPNSMGAVPGTSQAAAFVAGIAANMLNNDPSVYKEFGVLKLRLQACSWPLPYFVDGESNKAIAKLAAGVVDPAICSLDPKVAWVKREGSGWTSAYLKRWIDPQAGAFKDESGGRTGPALKDVLRVMKTDSSGESSWTIYSRAKEDSARWEKGFGQIKTDVAASIDKQAMIEFCDGSKLGLSELIDILPPAEVYECPLSSGLNADADRTRPPG